MPATILVLSGKGGVGKTTITTHLAYSLVALGHKVGLLDIDITAPSLPRNLNLDPNTKITANTNGKWVPITVNPQLCVVSMSFLLAKQDDPIIWRGPKKQTLIRQFIQNVEWGDIDYLVVDTPPGTGDEHLAILQNTKEEDLIGAILVTTPQIVALADVRREITFCEETKTKILGLIENMSGYRCPTCEHCTNIFSQGGGKSLAEQCKIPFMGHIPIDPSWYTVERSQATAQQRMEAFRDSDASELWRQMVESLNLMHNKHKALVEESALR